MKITRALRWEIDPDEQNFMDLMDTKYAKASLHWPSSHAEPKWEVRIDTQASGSFSGNTADGQGQAEAALRAIAEAIVKDLGGSVTWAR